MFIDYTLVIQKTKKKKITMKTNKNIIYYIFLLLIKSNE